ncbi:MAG: hypothetical protein LBU27_04605 [Candidatus Peribacteria bacterium]|jgi:hypothetical protein|nr:hypothetical protein [Candidatus Peribacteria bacterium]
MNETLIERVKVMNRFLCLVALISYSIFNVSCMNLTKPLSGDAPLRITTMIRSESNALVIDTEKGIIHSTLKNLIIGEPIDFKKIIPVLQAEVKKYINILINLQKLSDDLKTKLIILSSLFKKDFGDLGIKLKNEQINALAIDLLKKTTWRKQDFVILENRSDDFWSMLSDYKDDVSEISIGKYLRYNNEDILKYCCSVEDLAFYQAIRGLKDEIKRECSSLYSDSEEETFLLDMLTKYYSQQCDIITEPLKKGYSLCSTLCVTILVTNEYFWGKVPLSVESVHKLFSEWSAQLPYTMYCTNFLITEDEKLLPKQIKGITSSLRTLHIPTDYEPSRYAANPYQDPTKNKLLFLMETEVFSSTKQPSFLEYLQYLDTLPYIDGIFKNESMIFFNGKLLTTYNKATYIDEQNELLDKYLYKFGTGLDEVIDADSPEGNVVHQYISTQICRDAAAGIRKNDKGKQRFHILQSNRIGFDGSAIPQEAEYVIHANFGSAGAIYRRAHNLSSTLVSKEHMWDPVGPFDFHISLKIGSSIYNIQTLRIHLKM